MIVRRSTCPRLVNAEELFVQGERLRRLVKTVNWEVARNGTSGRFLSTPNQIIESFWRKVEVTSGCWLWIGAKWPSGYGYVHVRKDVMMPAHRLSYIASYGVFRDVFVCHHCDVRLCVRPDHLFLGTNEMNVADCVSKNRQVNGSTHPLSKLDREKVIQIFKKRNIYGFSLKQLSDEYGVAVAGLSRILNGKIWKFVDVPIEYRSRR